MRGMEEETIDQKSNQTPEAPTALELSFDEEVVSTVRVQTSTNNG